MRRLPWFCIFFLRAKDSHHFYCRGLAWLGFWRGKRKGRLAEGGRRPAERGIRNPRQGHAGHRGQAPFDAQKFTAWFPLGGRDVKKPEGCDGRGAQTGCGVSNADLFFGQPASKVTVKPPPKTFRDAGPHIPHASCRPYQRERSASPRPMSAMGGKDSRPKRSHARSAQHRDQGVEHVWVWVKDRYPTWNPCWKKEQGLKTGGPLLV